MNQPCSFCPRKCGASRTDDHPGFCGASEPAGSFRVARLMAHHWEEPAISGTKGSGTIFFSGCNLGCCFCQNHDISRRGQGSILDQAELTVQIFKLVSQGVHNLNLVTASHYADQIPNLIRGLRQHEAWPKQNLPVVWNSSSYETVESIEKLSGTVDIFLPDLKFFSPGLSGDLAGADDYFEVASQAILAMRRLQPDNIKGSDGLLQRGLIVRHLVLPGQWRDSCQILDFLAAHLPLNTPISIMSQYTPQPILNFPDNYPELKRRLTTFEYRKVLDHALKLGFSEILGQSRLSADSVYTPDFSSLWDSADR